MRFGRVVGCRRPLPDDIKNGSIPILNGIAASNLKLRLSTASQLVASLGSDRMLPSFQGKREFEPTLTVGRRLTDQLVIQEEL